MPPPPNYSSITKPRRGKRATFTVNQLLSSTKKLRQHVNEYGRIEVVSMAPIERNRQLIMRFEVRPKTPGHNKYPAHIVWHKVDFASQMDRGHPLTVVDKTGHKIYAKQLSANTNPLQVRCACFTGDTKVLLPDGYSKRIDELCDVEGDLFVYAFDRKTKKRVIAKAHPAAKLQENALIYQVALDNGYAIKCTGDHKFLMKDGSYVQAKDLQPNDSLQAVYRRLSDPSTQKSVLNDYEQYYEDGHWKYTHRLADKWNVANGITDPNRVYLGYMVRHHKDFRKRNNRPDNIVRMGKEAHFILHATHHTPAIRASMSRAMKKRVTEGRFHYPLGFGKDHIAVKAVAAGTHHTLSQQWKDDTGKRQRDLVGKGKHVWQTKTWQAKKHHRLRNFLTNLEPGVHVVTKEMAESVGYLRRVFTDNLKRTLKKENFSDISLVVGKVGRSGETRLIKSTSPENHRVLSVQVMSEKQDVYCLHVPEYNNFAIQADSEEDTPSGIFVHNCLDFYFTWWHYDYQNRALSGAQMRPYVRKTPPPPVGYPYRNPIKVPGVCKHLIGIFKLLQRQRILIP